MIWSTVVTQVMVQSELVSGDGAIISRIRKVYEEKPITAALRIPVLLNTKTLVRGGVLRVYAKKKDAETGRKNHPDLDCASCEKGKACSNRLMGSGRARRAPAVLDAPLML